MAHAEHLRAAAPGGWLLHYDAVSETDGTVTESSVRLTDEPTHIALRSGACLLHLDPETQTQARLLEGEQDSTPMTVTTREAEWRLDAPDEGQIIMHYLLTLGGRPSPTCTSAYT